MHRPADSTKEPLAVIVSGTASAPPIRKLPAEAASQIPTWVIECVVELEAAVHVSELVVEADSDDAAPKVATLRTYDASTDVRSSFAPVAPGSAVCSDR
jgi:hypothetical protein